MVRGWRDRVDVAADGSWRQWVHGSVVTCRRHGGGARGWLRGFASDRGSLGSATVTEAVRVELTTDALRKLAISKRRHQIVRIRDAPAASSPRVLLFTDDVGRQGKDSNSDGHEAQ
ncbi:hypothetical protein E2542_SST09187 [Spatholobus suberectus]|nr:hypothetical protein E2542_SST09187 [Spatholobus suberectus]